MMNGKRFFLFLTLIGMLGLMSCTGVNKSRCDECPEFTHMNNDFFFNNQKTDVYETHNSYPNHSIVCSGNE